MELRARVRQSRLVRSVIRRAAIELDRRGIPHTLQRDRWVQRVYQTRQAFRRAGLAPRKQPTMAPSGRLKHRHILIPDMEGVGPLAPFVEFSLATALRQRGAQVTTLQCDGAPHCEIATVEHPGRPSCRSCVRNGRLLIDAFDLSEHAVAVSKLVDSEERAAIEEAVANLSDADLRDFIWRGIEIGRGVRHYLPNYFRRIDLDGDPQVVAIERRSLVTASLMACAMEALIARQPVDKVILFHGPTLTRFPIWEVARRHDIPIDAWEVTNRRGTLGFAHGANASHGDLQREWPRWKNVPLTDEEEARLDEYLGKRFSGKPPDTRVYHADALADQEAVRRRLGLRPDRPLAVLFTNCSWDGAVLSRNRAFSEMNEWLEETIRYFISRPDLDLVIRVHPAELQNGTRQKVGDDVLRKFPELPDHIKLIPASEMIQSYTLMEMASVGLVYATTVGLEMALLGKPVSVAGVVHYRGKGFTLDVDDRGQYQRWLEALPACAPPSSEARELARRYAYLRYFRWMIPFQPFSYLPTDPMMGDFRLHDVSQLAPGCDAGIDALCEGILNDASFLLEDPESSRSTT